jgi:hypothetical protein
MRAYFLDSFVFFVYNEVVLCYSLLVLLYSAGYFFSVCSLSVHELFVSGKVKLRDTRSIIIPQENVEFGNDPVVYWECVCVPLVLIMNFVFCVVRRIWK